eukprot:1160967-Pelagomonas_calceolata.AAC.6
MVQRNLGLRLGWWVADTAEIIPGQHLCCALGLRWDGRLSLGTALGCIGMGILGGICAVLWGCSGMGDCALGCIGMGTLGGIWTVHWGCSRMGGVFWKCFETLPWAAAAKEEAEREAQGAVAKQKAEELEATKAARIKEMQAADYLSWLLADGRLSECPRPPQCTSRDRSVLMLLLMRVHFTAGASCWRRGEERNGDAQTICVLACALADARAHELQQELLGVVEQWQAAAALEQELRQELQEVSEGSIAIVRLPQRKMAVTSRT